MGRIVQTSSGVFEEVTDQNKLNEIERLAGSANTFLQTGKVEQGINQETVTAIQKAAVQRDQSYSGNNAGFVGYILEDGAKFIIPQLTPLRNSIPRRPMPGIDKVNYRTILDYFNGSGPSVGAGILDQYGTPKKVTYKFKDLNYTAKMIAQADLITEETQIYGKSFEGDVLAVASAKLIPALMQIEEVWLINSGEKSQTPAPPLVTPSNSGGSLAALHYWVAVTAVNAQGETLPTVTVDGGSTSGSSGSLAITLFTNGLDDSVTKYNVYVGTGSTKPATSAMWLQGASNFASGVVPAQLTGVATGNQVVTITSILTSGTALSTVTSNTAVRYPSSGAGPNPNAPLTFDGMLALVLNNYNSSNISTFGVGGEAPYVVQPASSAGTLVQLDMDTLLENMFLNAHADPDVLYCSVKDHKTLTRIVSNGTNARVVLNADDAQSQGNLVVGYRATAYINQTTGKIIPIKMLPYLQQGMLVFGSHELPFQVQGLDEPPFRVGYNRDMYSRVYPPDQSHPTQTLVAAYLNESLINEYLGGWSVIQGIVAS